MMIACRFKQSKETISMYSSQFYVSSKMDHLQHMYPITAVGLGAILNGNHHASRS